MFLLWLRKRAKLLYATLSYLLSILILLSALYWFLRSNGFDETNFLIGSSAILLIAFAWGYTIASDLLEPKRKMDAKFEHLSREILHELNIPLSTINANIKMLQKNYSDEKSQRRLQRVESASIRLKRLYDELAYSINRELHSVEYQRFALLALLEERIDTLREFDRNPFDLAIDELYLYTDKIGFEQMIDNLLINAMKYSHKNSPILIYIINNTLHIEDQGIGMNEAELVKIYERYYQSDREQHGDGIGLALVKAYCDEANIAITIQSQKSIGTTVKLDLKQVISERWSDFEVAK